MKRSLILLICLLAANATAATFPSHWDWRQISTSHFKVIYPSEKKDLAEAYARGAERAWMTLAPLFLDAPPTPIPVLLADNTDLANGSATFLPYALITVFPALPDSTEQIGDYQDWAYEMMLHELTHLFSFAPVHGFYRPLYYLFGNVIHPNGILPRWYLEGLAVEAETRFSNSGRLRSPSTLADIRELTVRKSWEREPLAYINESNIGSWPFGQRPYLFGSLLWRDLTREKGPAAMNDLTNRFGYRLPFFLNGPIKDLTDKDWNERLESLYDRLGTQSQQQIADIKNAGDMPTSALQTAANERYGRQALSGDGLHLAFVASTLYKPGQIRVIDRSQTTASFQSQKPRVLTDSNATTRLSWLRDSSGLVFDRLNIHDRYLQVRDLFMVSLKTGEVKRLTEGARASQPCVSPDGKRVAFIANLGGRHQLEVLDLGNKRREVLFISPLGLRLGWPEFLDDNTILFAGRNHDGQEKIYLLARGESKPRVFASLKGSISEIHRVPQGFLVGSNHSGVANVYLVDRSGKLVSAASNSPVRILHGELDPYRRELIFEQVGAKDSALVSSPLKVYHPPKISLLPELAYLDGAGPTVPASAVSRLEIHDEAYSPWPHLIPTYWIPFIYPVEKGVIFQGTTQIQEPTNRHTLGLDGSYDSVTNQFSYGVAYTNSTTPADLTLQAAQTNELLSSSSSRLTNERLAFSGSGFFAGLSNSWKWGLMASRQTTELPSPTGTVRYTRAGPSAQVNYLSGAKYASAPAWGEGFASLTQTQYLSGGDNLAYGRSAAVLGLRWRGSLPSQHYLLAQGKGSFAPDLPLSAVVPLGDRTIGGNYLVSLINSQYLLRGYPSGALVGRSLASVNLEYHAHLFDLNRGWGIFPLFLRSLDSALIFDAASVDGAFLSPKNNRFYRISNDAIFTGTGVEFSLNSTAAYHLPVSLTLGLYYGFDARAGGGFTTFLSLGYVGHGGVDDASTSTTRSRPSSFAL